MTNHGSIAEWNLRVQTPAPANAIVFCPRLFLGTARRADQPRELLWASLWVEAMSRANILIYKDYIQILADTPSAMTQRPSD
jgi:hypothetical protein